MTNRVDALIQLMRLSGTDKVREYLENKQRNGRTYFLAELEVMFEHCKRDSVTEAWPTMAENDPHLCKPAPAADTPAVSTQPLTQIPAK